MSYNLAEKNHLIEQIKNLTGSRPLFYLKFCSNKNFARDVSDGNLYGNTAEWFRNKEIETGERGQGDQFELLSLIEVENINVIDNATGNTVLAAPQGQFKIQFKADRLIPIVSFVGIPLEDMELIELTETHANFIFPFTDEEYKIMKKRFGEYCVILGAREIEEKISVYCNQIGCDYIFEKVEYCDQNRIDRIQAFNKSSKNRFLYKNSDLSYQREYRLAMGIEIPDDHFMRVGMLNTAKIIDSDLLKNLMFSIRYTSDIK